MGWNGKGSLEEVSSAEFPMPRGWLHGDRTEMRTAALKSRLSHRIGASVFGAPCCAGEVHT